MTPCFWTVSIKGTKVGLRILRMSFYFSSCAVDDGIAANVPWHVNYSSLRNKVDSASTDTVDRWDTSHSFFHNMDNIHILGNYVGGQRGICLRLSHNYPPPSTA